MGDVVVIGGANVDIKAHVDAQFRIGTSNPGTVILSAGGVGRNIAHNLGKLGVQVSLATVLGNDAHGDFVLRETRNAGVNVQCSSRAPIPTGTYVATFDADGELVSAVSDMRILETIDPAFVDNLGNQLDAAKIIVADCNLPLATLLKLVRGYGEKLVVETVSVEKSKKLLLVLAAAPILCSTPNIDQIESLIGSREIPFALAELHRMGIRNIIVNAGAYGAFVFDGVKIVQIEPRPSGRIVDVTGAGDAALAGVIHGLLNGHGLHEAAEFGQELAGRVIASKLSTLE
jgi:pseudouridine kinase